MKILRFAACMVFFSALFLGRAAFADTYSIAEDQSKFGTLTQDQVAGAVPPSGVDGSNFCVPTATINSFTFLSKAYANVYGAKLMGGQTSWAAAGALLASAAYMDTGVDSGTTIENWISGKVDYINHFALGTTVFEGMSSVGNGNPIWVTSGNPTASFLAGLLQHGEDVEIGILPSATGIGHALTLTSIAGDTADGYLTIGGIDPANGASFDYEWDVNGLGVMTTFASAVVGNDYAGYSLDVALGESPSCVPEPMSMIFFATGMVAVGGFVTRRKMLRSAA